MRDLHRRLTEVGLKATEEYGFVLAGGYALSTHGMGDRPSKDVDLFTNEFDPERFAQAADRLRHALGEAGLAVEDKTVGPTFLDIRVTDPATGQASDMQLGANYREFPPTRLEIGPVLDVRDAVAGKMSALWSRGEARDYVDIDTVISSGRFTREEVLAIGDRQEATPMDRAMLAERFRGAGRWEPEIYAAYEVGTERRARIIERFAEWADRIDPARPVEGPQQAAASRVREVRELIGYRPDPDASRSAAPTGQDAGRPVRPAVPGVRPGEQRGQGRS